MPQASEDFQAASQQTVVNGEAQAEIEKKFLIGNQSEWMDMLSGLNDHGMILGGLQDGRSTRTVTSCYYDTPDQLLRNKSPKTNLRVRGERDLNGMADDFMSFERNGSEHKAQICIKGNGKKLAEGYSQRVELELSHPDTSTIDLNVLMNDDDRGERARRYTEGLDPKDLRQQFIVDVERITVKTLLMVDPRTGEVYTPKQVISSQDPNEQNQDALISNAPIFFNGAYLYPSVAELNIDKCTYRSVVPYTDPGNGQQGYLSETIGEDIEIEFEDVSHTDQFTCLPSEVASKAITHAAIPAVTRGIVADQLSKKMLFALNHYRGDNHSFRPNNMDKADRGFKYLDRHMAFWHPRSSLEEYLGDKTMLLAREVEPKQLELKELTQSPVIQEDASIEIEDAKVAIEEPELVTPMGAGEGYQVKSVSYNFNPPA